ncbi:MAG: hypothetical protein JNN08_20065 [Bryobacterales bacterium]|nr:hypothetical protein [Bryobacterales bacterium]
MRLPFLNHPIQGDDAYYLAMAQHAQIEPLHPTHFRHVSTGIEVDMRGYPRPAMNAWVLALLPAIFYVNRNDRNRKRLRHVGIGQYLYRSVLKDAFRLEGKTHRQLQGTRTAGLKHRGKTGARRARPEHQAQRRRGDTEQWAIHKPRRIGESRLVRQVEALQL